MAKTQESNGYRPRLKEAYLDELRARLQEELGLENVMQVPRPVKVIVNMGVAQVDSDVQNS
jgi:large subunit ribosomal protein L5